MFAPAASPVSLHVAGSAGTVERLAAVFGANRHSGPDDARGTVATEAVRGVATPYRLLPPSPE